MKRLVQILAVILVQCGVPLLATAADGGAPHQTISVVSDDNYPPYIFRDAEGHPEGYLVDFWKLWESKTGIHVRFVPTNWSDAQQRMRAGEFDVIDTIFKTPEREAVYSFSQPYATLPVAIYAHRSVSGIYAPSSLRGFQIGVETGDACIDELQRRGITSLVLQRSYVALIEEAKKSDIKLFCMDEGPANYYLYRAGLHTEFVKAFDLYQGQFHRAVRRGDEAILVQIEQGIAAIGEDELKALNEKWMGTPIRWEPYSKIVGIAFASLLLLGAGMAFWVRLLKVAVARKTRELQAKTAHLEESEERFRALFEDTVQPIALTDEARFIAANEATLAMLRMEKPEELIGRVPWEISPPTQADGRPSVEKAAELIEETFAKGSNCFEWTHQRADGTTFEARILLTTIYRDNRRLLHVIWNDISKQKSDERELAAYRSELEARVAERTATLAATAESLRVANAEQKAIFEATTVGIVFIRERKILRCNRAVEELFGYSRGELEHQSTRLLYSTESEFNSMGAHVEAHFDDDETFSVDVEMMRKNGSRFWAHLSIKAVEPGNPKRGLVSIIEDITPERDAFNALTHAKALAEETARTKADFVANMSHEIRTPMTAILGFTHRLQQSELTPRQRDYLRKVRVAAEHLLTIINDVLDFSKLEAGKMHIEHVRFELSNVLSDASSMVQERCTEKGLGLLVDLASDVPTHLVGDPVRLTQVLTNYVSNAVKFSEHGNIVVRVEKLGKEGQKALLRFSVSDSGIGLSEDQKQRLFESFQQADGSISRKYGGTGLGLVISKRIATLLGGEVGVDSTPGQGSTFWFTARLSVLEAEELPLAMVSAAPSDRSAIAGVHVLLAEDNEVNQEVTKEFLHDFGVSVTIAENGAQALEMVKTGHFDLVLMDMQMPVMDGLTATREIRKLPGFAELPIIAITANAMVEDQTRCLEAGMNDHLGKPYQPAELYAILQKWRPHRKAE
ncbi:transporter substrate-binding domain-containing protein [Zoogloea sp. LCSB751]|uniref:transporter substrate-binding domain-containing protein n=1 Tax=Zoogloea sp. LCSB751 TaxID=1965277 RepID=UPI00137479D3|nr:transporter substrate-binding domain-containing protein [Zoogloea sp. LCSB751]